MPEILYPEGRAEPSTSSSSPAPGASQPTDDEPEASAPSRWQAAVVRVTVMVAIWLGY